MLRLDAVSRRYGTFTAVQSLSLHVAAGRIMGFLGPNGAGKTSTMKMIVGLARPSSGAIYVDGINVAVDPLAVKARLGYVPDRPNLPNRLTAREYLAFVAGLYRMDPQDAAQRSAHQLALFGLAGRADDLIESYSHGMKQRLVMASVLQHRPRLLVVDEPMVGLDPRGARLLKDLLRAEAERGLTVFLSTHTLEVADEVCDEVAVIDRGRLIACGPPAELRSRSGVQGRTLEEVFLQLTAEEGEPVSDF